MPTFLFAKQDSKEIQVIDGHKSKAVVSVEELVLQRVLPCYGATGLMINSVG
jgi:hypothetical protein